MLVSKMPWKIYPIDVYGKALGEKKNIREWEWRNGQLFAVGSFSWLNAKKRKSLNVWGCRIVDPRDSDCWIEIVPDSEDRMHIIPPGGTFDYKYVKVSAMLSMFILEYTGS